MNHLQTRHVVNRTGRIVFMAGMMLVLAGAAAQAAPERLPLKSPEEKAKQKAARQELKQLDLQSIQDPAVRNAILEITRYLNLNTKSR